jgi:hypothetical protein
VYLETIMIASDKRTVRCEGNLAEISDDDSSDGEERTPSESNAFADDDDDEELEVFTGAKKRSTRTRPKVVKASENPVAASPTQEVGKQGLEEEAPRSLVNLMAASVSAVEKGSIPTGASQSTQGKVASTGSGGVDEESKDAFGIAYKPMFKQKETNYNVPKGPAFEDEAEFGEDTNLCVCFTPTSTAHPAYIFLDYYICLRILVLYGCREGVRALKACTKDCRRRCRRH